MIWLARGIGNTEAIMHGAFKTKAIVICGTARHAEQIRQKYKVDTVSIHELDNLRGLNKPAIFDHYAVSVLVDDLESQLRASEELVTRLQAELDSAMEENEKWGKTCAKTLNERDRLRDDNNRLHEQNVRYREALEKAKESVNMECLKCRRACSYYCRECYQGEVAAERKRVVEECAKICDAQTKECENCDCCGASQRIADKIRTLSGSPGPNGPIRGLGK